MYQELVWSGACQFDNRISFDFGVTEYKGQHMLKGNLVHSPFPKRDCGAGFFLDSHYAVEHSVLMAANVDHSNQHEFNTEEDPERIYTIMHGRERLDAKDLGLDGEVWVRTDGFRELDSESGEVLFDWQTHKHIGLGEISYPSPADGDGPELKDNSEGNAWDAL